MAWRDRCVAAVLAAGLLLGMLAWRDLGPWAGIPTAMLALVVASAVYRVDSRRPGPRDDENAAGADPDGVVSTRRPAAARPSRSAPGS